MHSSSSSLSTLALAAATACLAPAFAQQPPAAGALKEVVVSGSRSEQDPDLLPQSIDVIGAQQIEQRQIGDIRDLARDLPNVSVQRAPARFTIGAQTGRDGNAGFNIRGLDGNRVLMLVDGVRLPRSYMFQSETAIGRDYLDIGLVKRVEVVRGPTSALYGSDGIAGMVNFITKEPADFLRDGRALGGQARLGYEGDVDGWRAGATLAGRPRAGVEWLLSLDGSRAHALDNQGSVDTADTDRTTPNPQTDKGRAALGKLVLRPDGRQKHVITAEHVDRQSDYELLSNIAKPPLAPTSVVGASARTDMRRNRLGWDGSWQLDAPWAERVQAMLAWQDARGNEYQFQDRNTAADRSRNSFYQERALQANLQAGTTLRSAAGTVQRLTYGLDATQLRVENLQTGTTPPAGESYPLKRFPDTKEKSYALYLQDEIVLGRWSITPGLRHDRFEIDASPDGYTAPTPPVSLSGSATSPKLGVVFRADDAWSVYGQYAAGFKAPTAGQVNGFFANTVANYQSIANPNLKPEKSQNLELGLRGRLQNLRLDLSVFTSRFKDFIEDNQLVGGSFSPADPAVFQSVNVARVKLDGFEIKGEAEFGRVGPGRLSMPFAYGRTRGRDRDTGQPINSVNPERVNLGLAYDWGPLAARLDATYRAAKKLRDIDVSGLATQFATPSATTLDLTAQWRIRPDLRLTAGIYNLTDRKYWNWSDVNGVSSTLATLDAWTQPGRYAKLTLVADF
ncbi:TonB-dependent hemoglobin/transferrin/lactoferrin family receptor [Pseudorhodoferax sp.]|uniref:TonB-dependent hemoglobin/transferrin/lactoferrin family receptor n=1 Tax=Pseudorhodoferax sp. TaxID=1993553 RepID=UPI0039E252F3